MGGWSHRHCRRGVRLTNWSEPLDFPANPIYLPGMKKIQFDSNGIYASSPKLHAIALRVLEQEKRERELRRSLTDEDLNGGQWGIWNISDRD